MEGVRYRTVENSQKQYGPEESRKDTRRHCSRIPNFFVVRLIFVTRTLVYTLVMRYIYHQIISDGPVGVWISPESTVLHRSSSALRGRNCVSRLLVSFIIHSLV